MSKADYFRRFAIWNRQIPEPAFAGPIVVPSQTVEVPTAVIENVNLATVIDRPPAAPPETKTESRKLTALARAVSAAPQSPTPASPAANYLNTTEAAEYCRLSMRTLERYRVRGGGPLFAKCGTGKRARVVYRRVDLENWLSSNTVSSTASWSVRSRKPR